MAKAGPALSGGDVAKNKACAALRPAASANEGSAAGDAKHFGGSSMRGVAPQCIDVDWQPLSALDAADSKAAAEAVNPRFDVSSTSSETGSLTDQTLRRQSPREFSTKELSLRSTSTQPQSVHVLVRVHASCLLSVALTW